MSLAIAIATLPSCVFDRSGLDGEPGGAGQGGATGASSSGGSASGGAGSGGDSGTGGSGGKPIPLTCGDGVLDAGEGCDDGNEQAGDGCEGCSPTPGYECDGAPSTCMEIVPISQVLDQLGRGITDNGYNGSLESMTCIDVVLNSGNKSELQWVTVTIDAEHSWVGDLVVKVQSPAGTISTLMSRPGKNEGADNGNQGGGGDGSDVKVGFPITFDDLAPYDAEYLGSEVTGGDCCEDDGRCDYFPNSGAGPGSGLSDFVGEDPSGVWKVCVGDADSGAGGYVDGVTLTALVW